MSENIKNNLQIQGQSEYAARINEATAPMAEALAQVAKSYEPIGESMRQLQDGLAAVSTPFQELGQAFQKVLGPSIDKLSEIEDRLKEIELPENNPLNSLDMRESVFQFNIVQGQMRYTETVEKSSPHC
jgi:DNA anti-recombination protein RmuC